LGLGFEVAFGGWVMGRRKGLLESIEGREDPREGRKQKKKNLKGAL